MTLQSSGAISATDIHNEFQGGTILTTMWEHLGRPLNTNTAPRGMPTGDIAYSDFYGKTAYAGNTAHHSGSFLNTTIGNGVMWVRVRDDLGSTSVYTSSNSGVTLSLASHASQVTPTGSNESWQAREVAVDWIYRTAYTPANNMYSYASVPNGYGDTINLAGWGTWISSGRFVGYNSAFDTSWPVASGAQFLRGQFTCNASGSLWQNSVLWKVQPEHINQSSANSGIICGIAESGTLVNTRFVRVNLT